VPCGYLVLHGAGDKLKLWLLGNKEKRRGPESAEPEVSAGD
jgi:hypothetical protein